MQGDVIARAPENVKDVSQRDRGEEVSFLEPTCLGGPGQPPTLNLLVLSILERRRIYVYIYMQPYIYTYITNYIGVIFHYSPLRTRKLETKRLEHGHAREPSKCRLQT